LWEHPRMPWRLTCDVAAFGVEAGPYLAADPATCTVLLTVCAALRTGGPCAFDPGGRMPARFGLWREEGEQGPVRGAFVQTPPHVPLLGPMPERAAEELAPALAADPAVPVDGARGPAAPVGAFTRAYRRGAGARVDRRMRLFRLGVLTPRVPGPAGGPRPAVPADGTLVSEWFADFGTAATAPALLARRIAEGRLLLWEDAGGEPVSMAGRSELAAGQVRIAPVYTPARMRRRGYAGAVTAAISAAAAAAGAEQVVLFTDLANATSNALYQRLGYVPVSDFLSMAW
jgi:FR47-like protein